MNPYPPCYSGPCDSRKCCGEYTYKVTWPNVVGMTAEQATAIIVHDNPLVVVKPVPKGSVVIEDFCCNRVWLWIDENHRVYEEPMVG
ncbi:glu s.griseus protease inhibitor [Phtheirospermum japonicum]|uniref:Glu s.griseus protease inhibitor n=1 Tax=Phtheirospermum japonicum TaxID=374723 RepID=A0A830D1X9_9LAMI|nr:glu s.griseus protease inhibitor [Phtheirospermum japonicum]